MSGHDAQLADLIRKCRGQAHAIRQLQKVAELHNREIDALHYVWCDGGCVGGVHRYERAPEKVTEEVVLEAEKNTKRLRTWWENRKRKLACGEHEVPVVIREVPDLVPVERVVEIVERAAEHGDTLPCPACDVDVAWRGTFPVEEGVRVKCLACGVALVVHVDVSCGTMDEPDEGYDGVASLKEDTRDA